MVSERIDLMLYLTSLVSLPKFVESVQQFRLYQDYLINESKFKMFCNYFE